jgi:hypothetical protein
VPWCGGDDLGWVPSHPLTLTAKHRDNDHLHIFIYIYIYTVHWVQVVEIYIYIYIYIYPVRCARQAATVPKLGNCVSDFNIQSIYIHIYISSFTNLITSDLSYNHSTRIDFHVFPKGQARYVNILEILISHKRKPHGASESRCTWVPL